MQTNTDESINPITSNDFSVSPDLMTVFCFYMDMIGATAYGIKLTDTQFRRFCESLIKQIKPHLDNLSLDKALKFLEENYEIIYLTENEQ